uniref:DNA 3'-5' helicase n=1 Tax=Gadus morhua TaxID=8049 RepID=A0A8C5AGZ1_GADMO
HVRKTISCKQPCELAGVIIVLVVRPLVAIMEDQVRTLQSKGIAAAVCGKDPETDEKIAAGHYSIVYGSAETLVGDDKWRAILQKDVFRVRLVGIAVDEVQGNEAPFREWCGKVGELRSLLPTSVPLLAMTATASKAMRQKLRNNLGMQQCIELVKSPSRDNIRLATKKVSSDPSITFAWLCGELESKGPRTEKVVIYCKSAKDVSANRLVDMYHSATPEDVKLHIMNSLKDPMSLLRVVSATSALGMGVDFKGVNNVVHNGPPRNIEAYMQAFGRAGRDGSHAHSIILYHGRQLQCLSDEMLMYVSEAKQCMRVKLLQLFDGENTKPLALKHACCSFCALSCDCQDTCDVHASPLEKHAGEGLVHKDRTVTDEQRTILRERLLSITHDMTHQGVCGTLSVYSTQQTEKNTGEIVIKEVMDSSSRLFTLVDIFCNVQVFKVDEAQAILNIVSEVFCDIEECYEDEESINVEDEFGNMTLF